MTIKDKIQDDSDYTDYIDQLNADIETKQLITNLLNQGTICGPEIIKLLIKSTACIFDQLSWLKMIIGVEPMVGPIGLVSLPNRDKAIEAYARKLQPTRAIEAIQDLINIPGIDILSDTTKEISAEVTSELETMILHTIKTKASKIDSIEEFVNKDLPNKFCIAPESFFAEYNLDCVHIVKNTDHPIFGYHDDEYGLYYAPYVLIMNSGVVLDANTCEPIWTLRTRYGMYENNIDKYFFVLEK